MSCSSLFHTYSACSWPLALFLSLFWGRFVDLGHFKARMKQFAASLPRKKTWPTLEFAVLALQMATRQDEQWFPDTRCIWVFPKIGVPPNHPF